MFNLFGITIEKFENIHCDEFEMIINNQRDTNIYEIIDVRTPEEYHAGHIPDAKLFNLMDPSFRNMISQLDPHKTHYVYCRSGSRSMTACRIMAEAGIDKLYNLNFQLL